ncbi:MAG: AMP-binding protein, partial [Gemmatimonadetes bacterium]|nr:AMP-binding protein [Gemmatimonadota bacterium]
MTQSAELLAKLTPEQRKLLMMRVARLNQGREEVSPRRVRPRRRAEAAPLSFAQERLWFVEQLGAEAAVYNSASVIRLTGTLRVEPLRRALEEIVRRHEVLRTTFVPVDGEVFQRVAPPAGLALPVTDLSTVAPAGRDAEVRRTVGAAVARPFDLAAGPLFRAELLRLDDREHVLLLTVHHAVTDGWSAGVLLGELATLYTAFADGGESPLPELEIQYADYAVWQREYLAGGEMDRQLGYWRGQLAAAPHVLDLPTDRPRPAVQSHRGASCEFALPAALAEEVRALAHGEGASPFMTLLAAFQLLLARVSGQDDVLVGTPIAGRTQEETERLVGLFVNTLVLRADLSANPTFTALLRQVRERTLGAYAHQDLPFEKLVEELRVERDLSRNPLFQAMFVLQNAPQGAVELPGLALAPHPVETEVARFDLTFSLVEEAGGISGVVEYATDLFDEPTVLRLTRGYRTLLEGIVAHPDEPVFRLPVLPPEERERVVVEWNRTAAPFEDGLCFHHLFERHAAATPDAPAVLYGEARLSYAELDARTRRLAARLRALGVGPETRVGVCAERSPDLVAAFLGVLRAGGTYVPLDPAYPRERLAYMLGDAAVSVLLTRGALLERLPEHGARVVLLDEGEAGDVGEIGTEPLWPENGAYLIYTSGSTGTPKGVLVPHRGLLNVAAEQRARFGVGPGERVLQFASPSFDASVFEMAMALGSGAALVLGSRDELLPGAEMVRLLEARRVSVVTLPPAALAALPDAELPSLRVVTVAGEACPAELVERWAPGRRFFNLYGPTEDTIWSSTGECRAGGGRITIGGPVANARAYVLDRWG